MTLKSNAEELALIAQEIGAEVIRGPLRYPGREGGFDIGDVDLEELLRKPKEREVILVVAPLGSTEELPLMCGLCGSPYEGDECPTCRAEREEAKRSIEERLRPDREEEDRLIRDVEEWLAERVQDQRHGHERA